MPAATQAPVCNPWDCLKSLCSLGLRLSTIASSGHRASAQLCALAMCGPAYGRTPFEGLQMKTLFLRSPVSGWENHSYGFFLTAYPAYHLVVLNSGSHNLNAASTIQWLPQRVAYLAQLFKGGAVFPHCTFAISANVDDFNSSVP